MMIVAAPQAAIATRIILMSMGWFLFLAFGSAV